VGRLVEALRGQDLSATAVAGFVLLCAFLGLMSHSLMYALRTIAPTFVESNASPEHRRLYWFEDVQQRGVREYIQTLQGLSDEQVLQEMAHELYSVQTITRAKFERIQRATRSAAASLMVWQVLMVLTFFLARRPGIRVADVGAGDGYYTVRLARRLGASAALYAQDVQAQYLRDLEGRLGREGIQGVTLVLGAPRDPRLPPASIDVAILSHMYHEIENPYEFLYRLHPALAPDGRVAIVDNDRPTQDHGTPPGLLRCELAALGYRQVDFLELAPAEGYLAVFQPPAPLPAVHSIKPCKQ